MLTFSLYISLLSLLLSSAVASAAKPYTPKDVILLNCGAPSSNITSHGRTWDSDATSKFSDPSILRTSSSSRATEQDPSVTETPYMTARIFRSQFMYSFPLLPGPKFIRLYFYPATYNSNSDSNSNSTTLDKPESYFTVTANQYTLLNNFSAFLTVSATEPQEYTIVKEFIVTVPETNQRLNLTFKPNSPASFAFINGIEIVSMPDSLYKNEELILDENSNNALETSYRLNVGGSDLSVDDDTGMFRLWRQDNKYIYGAAEGLTPQLDVPIKYNAATPNYTAPEVVYTTTRTMGRDPKQNMKFNLTWYFPVDSGFNYLLRLHFCEILKEVTRANERVFFIYINNRTVEEYADVIEWTDGRGIPVYRDFLVLVPDLDGRRSKQDLWLALHPNIAGKPIYHDAILNGLEIFKVSMNSNLAGSNPDPMAVIPDSPERRPNSPTGGKGSFPVMAIVGCAVGSVVVVLCILCVLIFRRRKGGKESGGGGSETKSSWVPFSYMSKSTKTSTSSSLPSNLCRHFHFAEIKSATSNFHDDFVIGVGGFGNVYKGCIDNESTTVAIKRLNPSSKQGVHEFHTEIKMLSKLRHLHLVSLIGYSDDNREMILVYDYMANGTLRDHLYNTNNPPISWKKRLQICIGAARGLNYLHTGAKQSIIHRDVKSTNILLDEKWVAKVSDFGLSKLGPTDVSHTHVTTVVKGSIGYLDPEYFRRQQLTEKSDVYSFGVVLLEVLCARPAVMQWMPKEQISLAEWGRACYRKGILDRIIDKNLKGQIAPECLAKFGEIANSCIKDQGIERPTMRDVVWTLEFAMQLQETAERVKSEEGGMSVDQMHGVSPSNQSTELTTTTDNDYDDVIFSTSDGHTLNFKSNDSSVINNGSYGDHHRNNEIENDQNVFSEIMNPMAR